ncbi:hypothetical protein [Thalassobacillus pellis]|uniref:hypothetical protein n=1 Tax=Thalassobacillus pellis TaxID=748008 RepID=UPI0019608AB1|nr:hypothetical protein [Thalassobacillus pellis]MBM7552435.1 uncharacterized protein YneF (UPF0154 family) [Thalassobacillus pellis]
MKTFMNVLLAFSGCFLAIYWLPFAGLPLEPSMFIYTIMQPGTFILGAGCLLAGVIGESYLFRKSFHEIFHYNQLKKGILIGSTAFIPVPLGFLSFKIVIVFYVLAIIYGIITIDFHLKRKRLGREWET